MRLCPPIAFASEITTGRERRRWSTANAKLAPVDVTMQPGMTVSAAARQHGVSPSLLILQKTTFSLQATARHERWIAASNPTGLAIWLAEQ